ncbi:MAG: alkaline phosphatase family protein [Halobacteriales archaeon]
MKVVVLGFDGMDPGLLDELVAEGRLPTFERLREDDVYSPIDSTVIPMSPAAWSSFLTGTNPGKHGIYDFITRTGDGINDFEVVTSDHRQAPSLWEYCNANDLRVGVVGVPITYPVVDLDGFMISGFPTPEHEESYAPDDLPERSPVPLEDLHPDVLYDGTNRDAFVADQFRLWDAMEAFHEFALSDLDWDVYVSVFKQTDDIAHICWGEEPLYEAYERADQVVADTIETLEDGDEEYLLVVMSDHGFGPIDKTLFLNNILLNLDHLQLRETLGTRVRRVLHRNGVNLLTAYRILARLGLAESVLSMSYDDSTVGTTLEWLRERFFLGVHDIDPDATDAFSRGNFGQIFLQDETVREDLMDALWGYDVDGEPIIEDLYTGDEEFHGPMAERAPDVMIRTPDYRYVTSRGFALATDAVLTDHVLQRTADHKPEGVFFAHGTGVEGNAPAETPTLEDLLPTIMAALGAPIPEYADGDVIEGLGVGAVERDSYDAIDRADERRDVDSERIREQLESLGYTG